MKQFDEMRRFAQMLAPLSDAQATIELIAQEAKNLVNADKCLVFMVDEEDSILLTKLNDEAGRVIIALDAGIVGYAYVSKEAQILNNPYEDPRFLKTIDEQSGYVTKNTLCVPIFNSKQNVMGILQLLNKTRSDFDQRDLETMSFFAHFISGSLELCMLENAQTLS